MALTPYHKPERFLLDFRTYWSYYDQGPSDNGTWAYVDSQERYDSGYYSSIWKALVAAQAEAGTPRQMYKSRITAYTRANARVQLRYSWGGTTGATARGSGIALRGYALPPEWLYPPVANVVNQWRAKLSEKAMGSFNGSTFLAEIRKTLATLRNPFSALKRDISKYASAYEQSRSVKRALRANGPPARAAARMVSGAWLEVAFGIMPSIFDIQAIAETLDRLMSFRAPIYPVSHKGGHPDNGWCYKLYDDKDVVFTPALRVSVQALRTVEIHTSIKSGIKLTAQKPSTLAGFDAASLALTAIEIVPYSWLVNYVIPFQDFVEGCRLWRPDLAYCDVTTTVVLVDSCWASFTPAPSPELQFFSTTPGFVQIEHKSVRRTIGDPGVFMPMIEVRSDVNAILNSLAALFSRHPKI